jgi:glycosyltransferase involved in cell wall biosynthesis
MRYPGIEFELVRHGIESRNASRPDTREGELRLLGVGRLVEKKGFEYLVEACEVLQRRGVPFTCRIVGEGPCEDALRRKIAGLGLEGRVQLEPFCSHAEIEGHYANAHVLIVPSVVARDGDRDGVPNVMLEAMAGGLPVVATDAGAIGEALIDGATGIGVPQRDPVAIADAVIKLSTDADLRHKVTVVARSVIEAEFSPKKWLDKLRRLFNQPKKT